MDSPRSIPHASARRARRAGDRNNPYAPFVAQVAGLSLPEEAGKPAYTPAPAQSPPMGLVIDGRV